MQGKNHGMSQNCLQTSCQINIFHIEMSPIFQCGLHYLLHLALYHMTTDSFGHVSNIGRMLPIPTELSHNSHGLVLLTHDVFPF